MRETEVMGDGDGDGDVMDMTYLGVEPDVLQNREVDVVLRQSLPNGFPLQTLLMFLPDVRLKQRADELAAEALAVNVTEEGGLVRADTALVSIREQVRDIEACFDGTKENPGPTVLANMLHKRLTGLRADFCLSATGAIHEVGKRIYDRTQQLKREAEVAQRAAQAQADQEARDRAARAAAIATANKAPEPVIEALQRKAETATAPPVLSPVFVPTLAGSTPTEKWRARFVGSVATEPPGELSDATQAERESALLLLRAVVAGQVPLVTIAVNWSYLDRRAGAERTTLRIPGIEAYDAGGMRAKPQRGRR